LNKLISESNYRVTASFREFFLIRQTRLPSLNALVLIEIPRMRDAILLVHNDLLAIVRMVKLLTRFKPFSHNLNLLRRSGPKLGPLRLRRISVRAAYLISATLVISVGEYCRLSLNLP